VGAAHSWVRAALDRICCFAPMANGMGGEMWFMAWQYRNREDKHGGGRLSSGENDQIETAPRALRKSETGGRARAASAPRYRVLLALVRRLFWRRRQRVVCGQASRKTLLSVSRSFGWWRNGETRGIHR